LLLFWSLHSPGNTSGNGNGDANAKDEANGTLINVLFVIKVLLMATGFIVSPPKQTETPDVFVGIFVGAFVGGACFRPNRVRFNPAWRRRYADLLSTRRAAPTETPCLSPGGGSADD